MCGYLIPMRVGTLGLMIHDLAFGGANDTGKYAAPACRPLRAENFFNATQPVLTMFPSHGAGTLHKPRVSVVFAIPGFKIKKHYLTLFYHGSVHQRILLRRRLDRGILWLLRIPLRGSFSD